MMKIKLLVFGLLFLLSLLTGCNSNNSNNSNFINSSDEVEYSGYVTESHTSTSFLIEGDAIGSNETPNDFLRRTVQVIMTVDDPEFAIGQGYIVKEELNSNQSAFLVSVENNSLNKVYCGIIFSSISFFNAVDPIPIGQMEDVIPGVFFQGGTRVLQQSDIYYDTCLGPNEKGFFFYDSTDLEININLEGVVKVEIGRLYRRELGILNESFKTIDVDVRPTGYRVGEGSFSFLSSQKVEVKFENFGSIDTYIFTHYFLLDSNNEPLYHGYLWIPNKGAIKSGETLSKYDDILFEGNANKILIYMGYLDLGQN